MSPATLNGDTEERVVCAALYGFNIIVCGARHWDSVMRAQIDALGLGRQNWEQGFLTNRGRFVTRKEAWAIAKERGQLLWGKERKDGQLFSEDLY